VANYLVCYGPINWINSKGSHLDIKDNYFFNKGNDIITLEFESNFL